MPKNRLTSGMDHLASFSGNLLVCRVGANLDFIRPGDLSEFADVNRLKKTLVRERGKNASSYISGKINYSLDAIGIRDPDTEV